MQDDHDQLLAWGRSIKRDLRTPLLRVGVVAAGAGALTTAAIASTMQAIPHARIEMRRLGFFDVAAELESGRVDVVFAPSPMLLPPRIRIEPLWLEPRVLVVPRRLTVSHDRETISILETNDEVFVAVAGGVPEVVDWWLVDPRPDGTRPKRGPTADSVDGLFELVAAGAGVNIAGQSAARQYRRDELAFVPMSDIESATIVLCSLTDTLNPMVKTFRETAQALSPSSTRPSTEDAAGAQAAGAVAFSSCHSPRRRACSSGSGTGDAAMSTRV